MTQTQVLIFACVILLIGVSVTFRLFIEQKAENDRLRAQQEKNLKTQRAVLGGKFAENLAPYFPDFPFDPTECVFIGKPVDFVVFKGSSQGQVSEIHFLEVKSGKARKSAQQKSIQSVIENDGVYWSEYRVPEDATAKVVNHG